MRCWELLTLHGGEHLGYESGFTGYHLPDGNSEVQQIARYPAFPNRRQEISRFGNARLFYQQKETGIRPLIVITANRYLGDVATYDLEDRLIT